MTSQKCYFDRSAIIHPCDCSAKVIVDKFLASCLQKPMPPLSIDIKDVCVLLTGSKPLKGFLEDM